MNAQPEPVCWRCGAPCETEHHDAGTLSQPDRTIPGATRCTNDDCDGSQDWRAHQPPTPEEITAEANRLWLNRQSSLTDGTPTGFITLTGVGGASRRETWTAITIAATALGGVGAYCWHVLT